MAANSGASDQERQIRQMISFIMQEAHEKVNEIRIKVRAAEFYRVLQYLDWARF